MPKLYADSDIFLNASVVDNQPVSILEAFASGLPVISTPTGDIPSMVRHGETGVIVPPEAPVAMARAIADAAQPARARAADGGAGASRSSANTRGGQSETNGARFMPVPSSGSGFCGSGSSSEVPVQ